MVIKDLLEYLIRTAGAELPDARQKVKVSEPKSFLVFSPDTSLICNQVKTHIAKATDRTVCLGLAVEQW